MNQQTSNLPANAVKLTQQEALSTLSTYRMKFLRDDRYGMSSQILDEIEEKDIPAALEEARLVLTANQPAPADELKMVIWGILNHYDSFDRRSKQSQAALIADWRESLGDYPVDLLKSMAKSWRESDTKGFMPTVGQVLAELSSFQTERLKLNYIARKALERFS